jgi:hypothetical protein
MFCCYHPAYRGDRPADLEAEEMKNIFLIIAGCLLGVILFQFLFYSCEKRKLNKEITEVNQSLNACLTAPVKVDTVVITNVLKDTIYLKYTHRVIDTIHYSDAIDWIDQTIEQRLYSGTYTHPQFEANWSAKVTGTLDEMTINPPSLIKSLVITKEKTVDISRPPEPAKEKSHLYFEGGWTYFNSVSGINADLMFIHKRGFGARGGISTDFERLGYNIGLVVRLK